MFLKRLLHNDITLGEILLDRRIRRVKDEYIHTLSWGCTCSNFFLFRYYSVKKLSLASNRQQNFRAVIISVLIWLSSFILSLPLLLSYDTTILFVFKVRFCQNCKYSTVPRLCYSRRFSHSFSTNVYSACKSADFLFERNTG